MHSPPSPCQQPCTATSDFHGMQLWDIMYTVQFWYVMQAALMPPSSVWAAGHPRSTALVYWHRKSCFKNICIHCTLCVGRCRLFSSVQLSSKITDSPRIFRKAPSLWKQTLRKKGCNVTHKLVFKIQGSFFFLLLEPLLSLCGVTKVGPR